MHVVLLVPYYTGSHKAWADGYAQHSQHRITLLSLQGRFWKWRMHGGAITLARRYRERELNCDLILATDMLDCSTWLALTRQRTHDIPLAIYMHENQLTYPTRPGQKRDLHYGFINYTSMLSAKAIFFNSQYHRRALFGELPNMLKHFPDHNELATVKALRSRSQVLPLGLSLRRYDQHQLSKRHNQPPLILWNHRWEYDKNPKQFFEALYALQARGLEFQVAILGEHFVNVPPPFEEAKERLGHRIVQFGYVEEWSDYARWLWRSDIVVSTAKHEFFGAAVAEAVYCKCLPILPDRLSYPQFVPKRHRGDCLYSGYQELLALLERAIADIDRTRSISLRSQVAHYDWEQMAPIYDRRLAELI